MRKITREDGWRSGLCDGFPGRRSGLEAENKQAETDAAFETGLLAVLAFTF